jgi:hypothetical protein
MLALSLQLMRFVRLIRLVKLFKHVDLTRGRAVGTDDHGKRKSKLSRLSLFSPAVKQSHVGQKLSELTTRRVVLGVLTMVLILPFLDITNTVYGEPPPFSQAGLHSLHQQGIIDSSDPLFAQALVVCSCSAAWVCLPGV